jgi:acyl-CoA synthetase (AMP-forming)/AMP-acid ligase II
MPPTEVSLDPAAVASWLDRARVTVVNATPLLLGLALGLSDRRLPNLRLVISGGAPLSLATAELIRDRAPGATLVNGYGCTETPQLATAATPAGGTRAGERRARARR